MKLADPDAISELKTLANAVITMHQAAAKNDGMLGPPPLAAR